MIIIIIYYTGMAATDPIVVVVIAGFVCGVVFCVSITLLIVALCCAVKQRYPKHQSRIESQSKFN